MTSLPKLKLDLRWRKLSIRIKLLLPVIAANILAFVILQARVPPPINSLVESNAQSNFTTTLTELRAPITQFLQGAQRDLLALSDSADLAILLAAVPGGDKAEITAAQAGVTSLFASKITEGQLPYMDIRYLDVSGKQLARATARQIGGVVSGVLVSNADLVTENIAAYWGSPDTLAQGKVYVLPMRMSAPAQNSGLSPEPLIELATPVYYDGKLTGYLVSSLRAHDFLTQAFRRSGTSKSYQSVLSDQQGRVIAFSNPAAADGVSILDDESAAHLNFPGSQVAGKLQTLATIGDRVYLSIPLTEAGAPVQNTWLLTVSDDLNSVYAGARDLESTLVITLSIVFILALGGIGLISQSMISPLVEVGHTANRVANGDLEAKAPVRSEDEVGAVALALNTMSSRLSNLIRTLEVRVQERTRNIEIAAEISRDTTQLTSLVDLLQRTVNAVQHRFGLYHVQIFLADEKHEYAVLVVGTGDAAIQMLAAEHRLAIGSASIVGQAMQSDHPVSTLDTERDAQSHQFNQYLPLTRSEMAVPMRIGDRTIGVLDVQSVNTDAFNTEDESVFQMIANQLAIAINNVRLFENSQEARRMADEANRQKSEFLSNMSHELRTPLNVIIGYSHSMLTRPAMYDDVLLPPAYAAAIESIRTSGQHLFGLINDILDLSKIEAGKIDLDIRPIDIMPILEGVRSTALGLVKNDVKIRVDYPAILPMVMGDETRIRQVLLNLLSNAAKFTAQGFITINAVAHDNTLQFSVADTGKGIPAEVQPHIFERFQQGSAMIGKKFGGTGLGLNISKQLVKMHGGDIWFTSEEGQGTTFYFTVPLAAPEAITFTGNAGDAPTIRSRAQIFGQTETESPTLMRQVLIVDTNSATRAMLESSLGQAGYSILSTDNHERAANVATALAPEVIIVHLHDNDGEPIKALPAVLANDASLALSSILTVSAEQIQASGTDLCSFVLEQLRAPADA